MTVSASAALANSFGDIATFQQRTQGDTTQYQIDGEEHPTGPEAVYVATWRDSKVLEIVARLDGEVLSQRKYEVSDDGRTLATDPNLKRL